MLVDIQGSGFDLFDPEIASTDLQDEVNKQYLYCTGNILKKVISTIIVNSILSLFLFVYFGHILKLFLKGNVQINPFLPKGFPIDK